MSLFLAPNKATTDRNMIEINIHKMWSKSIQIEALKLQSWSKAIKTVTLSLRF